jgi:hypothetical protein
LTGAHSSVENRLSPGLELPLQGTKLASSALENQLNDVQLNCLKDDDEAKFKEVTL